MRSITSLIDLESEAEWWREGLRRWLEPELEPVSRDISSIELVFGIMVVSKSGKLREALGSKSRAAEIKCCIKFVNTTY
jgi:hypothetical protein